MEHCIAESGLPNAMYSVEKEEFVYWWTGVLMPFQYSENREELENSGQSGRRCNDGNCRKIKRNKRKLLPDYDGGYVLFNALFS